MPAEVRRPLHSRQQVLEQWELLGDKWAAARSLGMKMPAFEKALQRARAATPPRTHVDDLSA
jgi:hypothetical protein